MSRLKPGPGLPQARLCSGLRREPRTSTISWRWNRVSAALREALLLKGARRAASAPLRNNRLIKGANRLSAFQWRLPNRSLELPAASDKTPHLAVLLLAAFLASLAVFYINTLISAFKGTYFSLFLIATNIPHLYLFISWNLGLKWLKSWGVLNELKQILQMFWNKSLFILLRGEICCLRAADAAVTSKHAELMVGLQQRGGEERFLLLVWFWPSAQSHTYMTNISHIRVHVRCAHSCSADQI